MWPLLSTKVKEKKTKKNPPQKQPQATKKPQSPKVAVAIFSNNKVVRGWLDIKWEGEGQNTPEKYLKKGFSLLSKMGKNMGKLLEAFPWADLSFRYYHEDLLKSLVISVSSYLNSTHKHSRFLSQQRKMQLDKHVFLYASYFLKIALLPFCSHNYIYWLVLHRQNKT